MMWNESLIKPFVVCRKNIKNPLTRGIYSVEFVIFKEEDDSQPTSKYTNGSSGDKAGQFPPRRSSQHMEELQGSI